ncbi:5'-methylthioadenosine/adenosylhomocysteine nucleosidase [Clostridium luticellarii]|jgi:adenosylhomocysteine nucleosidase|uniref:adenosylhomocysteine nucleosidase n=1 Tax=Clostridium luticellarii TaxID=1691940 RepID=A0A2T0BRS2_9CLOT|nr:5'-methylthioadenosine/adenosylhomocysteine nucleosidase [Clostridium luticellarii]MCI1943721.1 5'-methylthioadenosine/adenosylhomocysteine nucleosidase [Clostridium luticellarii]MCI1966982.1 5'-methylthioadenosine/adenosylhomocysteine nucleosidase [Clostridium luticellarii]MCI1994349.1 5'-methylthioadenosine/adenosylhomocysteine nucleosidase [Clostridium luticellarii]MCI2038698.1 5'-methylthioadenosine/adenosylhomocysteine nucleosidase [Clostridium luticellarii]PRR86573.1 5'-methylthioaden
MTIGIIGAMDEEVEILLSQLKLERVQVKANMKFNFGQLYNSKAVVVRSGIGKVNSAVCAQILIDDFNADTIINVGVAGGTADNVYPGDVVIADSLVQHDVDTSAFGDKIGQIPRMDTYDFKCDRALVEKAQDACKKIENINSFVGRIVTGDQFISSAEKIKHLNRDFNALACEMEGGSIAQVAYLNDIPFVIIRSISDNANNGASMDYKKFAPIAIRNSTEILKNMLINL